MSRSFAVESEVVRGPNDAVAEVVLPDAIDDDSPEERVVAVDDPVREAPAAFVFGRIGRQIDRGRALITAGELGVTGSPGFSMSPRLRKRVGPGGFGLTA